MGEILHHFDTGSSLNKELDATDHKILDNFMHTSAAILPAVGHEVYRDVLPALEQFEGYWHPLGFMAWKLGNIETLGTLRLHIWPRGGRKKSARGPKIHDHAWHISSLVLSGDYIDTLYDVDEQGVVATEEERIENGLLRVYSPKFSHTSSFLDTDGTCAKVTPLEKRHYSQGQSHQISVGIFHVDNIPDESLVTTLLIESPTIESHPRILMDTPAEPLGGEKIAVSAQEAIRAKHQVLDQGLYYDEA